MLSTNSSAAQILGVIEYSQNIYQPVISSQSRDTAYPCLSARRRFGFWSLLKKRLFDLCVEILAKEDVVLSLCGTIFAEKQVVWKFLLKKGLFDKHVEIFCAHLSGIPTITALW